MNPGEMRHEIKIGVFTTVLNTETGSRAKTWVYGNPIFAKVESTTSGSDEKDIAEKKTAVTKYVFTVRHRTDIQPKMRLVDRDDQVYDILAVLPENDRCYMQLECNYVEKSEDTSWT